MSGTDRTQWIRDERMLSVDEARAAPHSCRLALSEIVELLASPDSGLPLRLDLATSCLLDETACRYPCRGPLPILIPERLQPFFAEGLDVPVDAAQDAFLQYFLLSSIKQSGHAGPANAPSGDVHYQRHLFRMRRFLRKARGLVLDVGCDDPLVGSALLPPESSYLGLDPFCHRSDPFRVVGFAEYLPFSDARFDAVLFNTSLDHVLDWRRAIEEALRVLKPGGDLHICTLVWHSAAGLINDAVHFHHFREYEILGALHGLEVTQALHYDYKGDGHRHGLYLSVKKPMCSAS